jgi:hypothetical protein
MWIYSVIILSTKQAFVAENRIGSSRNRADPGFQNQLVFREEIAVGYSSGIRGQMDN